jgi:hypothetical protein
MGQEFEYDVFLSYSSKDKAVVRPLAKRLRQDGLRNKSQPSAINPQPPGAPLNQERRSIPLRLDDAPIKGSLEQFLYINCLPADREREHAVVREVPDELTWAAKAEKRVTAEEVQESDLDKHA